MLIFQGTNFFFVIKEDLSEVHVSPEHRDTDVNNKHHLCQDVLALTSSLISGNYIKSDKLPEMKWNFYDKWHTHGGLAPEDVVIK